MYYSLITPLYYYAVLLFAIFWYFPYDKAFVNCSQPEYIGKDNIIVQARLNKAQLSN